MKKFFIVVFFILLTSLVYLPTISPVNADCAAILQSTLNDYDSKFDVDFWSCKDLENIAPGCEFTSNPATCPKVPVDFDACKRHLFNKISTDALVRENPPKPGGMTIGLGSVTYVDPGIADGYDGSFKQCFGLNHGQATGQSFILVEGSTLYKSEIEALVEKKATRASQSFSTDQVSALRLQLDCGFAGDDASKNRCCTNTEGDLSQESIDNLRNADGPTDDCILAPFGGTTGCWFRTDFMVKPAKDFIINQVQQKQAEFKNQTEVEHADAFAVPKCIVGKDNGLQGDACMCEKTGGADICSDINPHNSSYYGKYLHMVTECTNTCEAVKAGILGGANAFATLTTQFTTGVSCKSVCESYAKQKYSNDSQFSSSKTDYDSFQTNCTDCMGNNDDKSVNKSFYTAIGCIPATPDGFIAKVFEVGIGLAGLIAFLCIIYSAFLFQTAQGDPERIKKAQELMTSCITGLMMIIFSIFILRVIGVDILRIPGFS